MLSLILAAALTSAPVSTEITLPAQPAPLHGTLLAPENASAVAVILPGSGPTDRDGNSPMGVRGATYRLLAEGLAEQGGQGGRGVCDGAPGLQFGQGGEGLGLQRFRQAALQLLAQHHARRAARAGQQDQAAHLVIPALDGLQGDQGPFAMADQPGAGLARARRRLGRPGAGIG